MPFADRVALGEIMRCVVVAAAVTILFLCGGARAEQRMFIIANDADDYGIDRCLVSNAACGTTVANAYCHSHEYVQALSFRKAERDDIAGTITVPAPAGNSCSEGYCGEFVAIECSR
jgi:hypothetical protein